MDPFLPYIASGRDIKLHFIVTRRASGASRQMYEPFMSAVLESGAAGLVLSGDRAEGQLFTGASGATTHPAGECSYAGATGRCSSDGTGRPDSAAQAVTESSGGTR